MFKKPFTIKTNTNVRNSDRRKIISKIDENAAELFGKSAFSIAVVTTATGAPANLYICEKQPIFFEISDKGPLFPTVYLAWQTPKSFPTLYLNEFAISYIENGADVMLPGVILNEKIHLPDFDAGSPICISIYSQRHGTVRGPVAIGRALMSSKQMIGCGMKGKGVQVLHIYQDELWSFGHRETIPTFEASEILAVDTSAQETPPPSTPSFVDTLVECAADISLQDYDVEELPPEEEVPQENEEPEDTEEFLRKVFLYALKFKLPEDQKFPLDVGQFYATYLLKSLPEGRKIDMKKTKYKKFSTFLQEVNSTAGEGDWFVKTTSKKGIDSILDVNFKHPEVQNAQPLSATSTTTGKTGKVKVAECFTITDASFNLIRQMFPLSNHKRGDILHPNDLSDLVKAYGNEKGVLKTGNKIELDDTLQSIVKEFTNAIVPVNDIVQKLSTHMTKAFLITTPDGRRILRKTQLPQIVLIVEKRTYNKNVTLVNNLQAYGIDPKELSHKAQNGCATGATIVPTAPNCLGPQVLINGNQVNFVVGLLDSYGVQKKYIKGAELGVKAKKGKK